MGNKKKMHRDKKWGIQKDKEFMRGCLVIENI